MLKQNSSVGAWHKISYFVIEIDDHWKKEFLGDNTAMLLTDVSRDVKNIQKLLNMTFQHEEESSNHGAKAHEGQQRNQEQECVWEENRILDPGVEVIILVLMMCNKTLNLRSLRMDRKVMDTNLVPCG